jgi:hypothetical protein
MVDEDLAGFFAQGGAGDVGVAGEAVEVYLGEDVAQGVVGEAEEEVVLAAHLAFEVEADVGEGFAGDGEGPGASNRVN